MYKDMLKSAVEKSIEDIEKPCLIPSSEIAEKVKAIWKVKGIEITSNRIGKIMKELGYLPYSNGQQRGWIIQ